MWISLHKNCWSCNVCLFCILTTSSSGIISLRDNFTSFCNLTKMNRKSMKKLSQPWKECRSHQRPSWWRLSQGWPTLPLWSWTAPIWAFLCPSLKALDLLESLSQGFCLLGPAGWQFKTQTWLSGLLICPRWIVSSASESTYGLFKGLKKDLYLSIKEVSLNFLCP